MPLRNAMLGFALALFAAPASMPAADAQALPDGRDFGAGLTLERAITVGELVGNPARYAGQPVLVRGRISDVCQRKGCWTVLSQGRAHIRVRFKDYGFFLPTDCSGAEALVEGMASIETLSEATARHYESESRDGNPDRVRGPRQEVSFTASGVRLVGHR